MSSVGSSTSSRLYIALSTLLAVGLLWLAVRDADWRQMSETIRSAKWQYLSVSLVTLSASYFVRGLRWRVLLSPVKTVDPLTVFWATMIGYLGNNFLPARAGELIRTVYLGRSTNIGKSYILATAFTERIMDLLFLCVVAFASVLWERNTPKWMVDGAIIVGVIGLIGVGGVSFAPRLAKFLYRLVMILPVPPHLRPRLFGLLDRFLFGLEPLHNHGRAMSFLGLTTLIWLTDALAVIAIARSFDIVFTLPVMFLLLAALGLSSALPSTPGSIGIFQYVAIAILTPFGISRNDALVFIIAFQAVIYVSVVAWGTTGIWQLSKSAKGDEA